MPTVRLYHQDAYATTFSARVTALRPQGKTAWVALAETCFYPSAGGQPHDTGTLTGVPVVDVVEEGDTIWHLLQGPPPAIGEQVVGAIDWPRRYRHMQRHSAQHLLSQAFLRLDPTYETRAVSLQGAVCTIDLGGNPSSEALHEAEVLVNRVAYENLPIESFVVAEADVARYPLRRPPKVRGEIRLVRMGEFELSACGGTHLRRTAEVLPIKVLGLARIRGNLTRVSFSAGLEAQEDYRLKHAVTTALAQRLSAQPGHLVERVEALRLELHHGRQQITQLVTRLAALRAEALLAAQPPKGTPRLVKAVLGPSEADLLQPLAAALTQRPGVVALLGVQGNEHAELLLARSRDLDIAMPALLQRALPYIGGRGGGRPEQAQGGGNRPEGLEAALDAALQGLP